MPTKTRLELPNQLRSRQVVYAGFLDLANGARPWSETLNDLKFAALFYSHILVPDGFVHCYGPIFWHLRKLCTRSDAEIRSDSLVQLLKARVLVPAIRRGDSIFDNWDQGQAGVDPGKYLIVGRVDGKKALALFDQHVQLIDVWPNSLAPDAADRRSRCADAVRTALIDERSPLAIQPQELPKDLPWSMHSQLAPSQALLEGFLLLLEDADGNPSFRRGDVEQYVSCELGIPFSSYQDIVQRVDWADPYRTLTASYGYMLLAVASTAYELLQAAECRTVASLFPLHDPTLIDAGVCNALADLSAGPQGTESSHVAGRSLDVTHVSVSDVLHFRSTARNATGDLLFEEYIGRLCNLKAVPSGASFLDANDDFVHFLCDDYVPAFLKSYPKAGVTAAALQGATVALGGIARYLENGHESLQIKGVSLYTIVSAVTALAGTASVVPGIRGYIRSKVGASAFRRNNFAWWREGRP